MDSSPLSSIPPELLNNILDLVLLASDRKICFWLGHASDGKKTAQTALSLAATCCGLRGQVLPMFFGSNTFVWRAAQNAHEVRPSTINREIEELDQWLGCLGPAKHYILTLRIEMGNWMGPGTPGECDHRTIARTTDRIRRSVLGMHVDVRFQMEVDAYLGCEEVLAVIEPPFSEDASTLFGDAAARFKEAIRDDKNERLSDKQQNERWVDLDMRSVDRVLAELRRLQDS